MILKVNSLIKKLFLNQYLEKKGEQRFPSLPESPQRTSISVRRPEKWCMLHLSITQWFYTRTEMIRIIS